MIGGPYPSTGIHWPRLLLVLLQWSKVVSCVALCVCCIWWNALHCVMHSLQCSELQCCWIFVHCTYLCVAQCVDFRAICCVWGITVSVCLNFRDSQGSIWQWWSILAVLCCIWGIYTVDHVQCLGISIWPWLSISGDRKPQCAAAAQFWESPVTTHCNTLQYTAMQCNVENCILIAIYTTLTDDNYSPLLCTLCNK